MMNPEIKANWLAALRSGKYRQGTHRLRTKCIKSNEESFCCLGVLVDIAWPNEWKYICNTYGLKDIWSNTDEFFFEASLSPTKLNEAKLTKEQQSELVALNDIRRASFAEIADYIEKNL